ncbi:6-phosphogluconate dehydrogenase C-terminal domain-like protein [Heliocybe sulcata]|uniref:6-phosphogluconate dehydrogenase C-terminal domain-like protein n=1 Tax=Heliocybe sulcata TaxID=5364 RepID=A0A5C3MUW7_9AGAM|nr:6-phosphogluconate dehydrogenase C-terminal domain-like protein [Heliocybe sulcata]
MAPRIAVVAAGAMGAAVGKRLTSAGCTVFTTLEGRSSGTRKRAEDAGMQDATLSHIAKNADWVLSILPPSEAYAFAKSFLEVYPSGQTREVGFADCNAVSTGTIKRIRDLFEGTGIKFIDAGIIGGPPRENYDPTFYASADSEEVLNSFVELNKYGMKIKPLIGEGSGIGDASALKMSYAGIQKGLTGLTTTVILAAHASSPATAQALISEMSLSQPALLQRTTKSIPDMLPKAYRWVGEMEEISAFVGESGENNIHKGLASTFARVEKSLKGDNADVEVLKDFVERAKKVLAEREGGPDKT